MDLTPKCGGPVLGLLTSTTAEARRQSAGLLEEGRIHRLFGTQQLEFRDERLLSRRDSGGFATVIYFEDDGEISPAFVEKLQEFRVDTLVNAGTLNSWMYSLVCTPKYAFDLYMARELPRPNFPGRHEMIDLVLTLEQCETLEIQRLAAVRAAPVGPAPGWSACPGPPPVSEAAIAEAFDRAQQRIAADVEAKTRSGLRGLDRVAYTCVSENGTIVKADARTDNCIAEMRGLPGRRSERLLVKTWQPRQTPLDPPAIGPKTIQGAQEAGFTAIVMPCDGLIFDRKNTLAMSEQAGIPIFGI